VFDYKKGKTFFEVATLARDFFIQGMVSLQEVLRQDPNRPLKLYDTAVPSYLFLI
jgi:hypothetical protein